MCLLKKSTPYFLWREFGGIKGKNNTESINQGQSNKTSYLSHFMCNVDHPGLITRWSHGLVVSPFPLRPEGKLFYPVDDLYMGRDDMKVVPLPSSEATAIVP
jgi:hypothetical protein